MSQKTTSSRTLVKKTPELVGQTVTLKGWVETKRDHGKITFIDLRDRSGVIQCIGFKMMGEVTTESVISVTGEVKQRPERMVNKDILTGKVELEVKEYEILNLSKELPIQVDGDGLDVKEEARLKYRYLDLRRERMRKNLQIRSKMIQGFREYLFEKDFVEVETPLLSLATKEGARDFIVPSRFNPGKFYALPQSPQQHKQLLMTAGLENYFQIAKCVRDEDLRADRGFEFTQLDLETSFASQDEVMSMVEEMTKYAMKKAGGKLKDEKFPVFTYEEAMEKFGADKFDLRTDEEKKDGTLAFAWVVRFPFFKEVDKDDAAEVADGKSGWTFTHNPFSTPLDEHIEQHLEGKDLGKIIAAQYDLVCNGYEAGGGSIRAHKPEVLRATFKNMGYNDEQIEASIGHMLEAFEVGTPPHGGIAMGIDRLAMILAGETSIKEVIAFPMNSSGKTSVMNAPAKIDKAQLEELSLKVIEKKK